MDCYLRLPIHTVRPWRMDFSLDSRIRENDAGSAGMATERETTERGNDTGT